MRCLTSLNQPKDFTALLSQRPVATAGPFVLHLTPRLVDSTLVPPGPRLGMVLPKRMIRRAVARNQIKRWIRPLACLVLEGHSVDLLVGVRGPLNLKDPSAKQRHKEELALTFSKIADRLGVADA